MDAAPKIKLSNKQKEVVLEMRAKAGVFRWLGVPYCRFDFKGKTFRYDMGSGLQNKGIIESLPGSGFINFYQLTDLGKTIDIN
jgi:hypothetical protein